MIDQFQPWKKMVFGGIVLLAIAGLFDALQNLPVVSNCAFYAECSADLTRKPGGD